MTQITSVVLEGVVKTIENRFFLCIAAVAASLAETFFSCLSLYLPFEVGLPLEKLLLSRGSSCIAY